MIVLFSVIKRKSTARISFVAYLSTIIIGAASFVSAVQIVWYKEQDSAYGIFACGVALAAILVIPYALVLCTFEPKEIRKLVRHSVNEEEQSTADSYAKVIESKSLQASEEESRVLQLSYEFSSKATECFSDKNGLSLLLDHVNKTKKGSGYSNLPNQNYESYFNVSVTNLDNGHKTTQTKINSKGLDFIYDFIKESIDK